MPLLAIEVELNGKRITVAGADDLSVLTAHVVAVGLLGITLSSSDLRKVAYDLHLHVSGLTSRRSGRNTHLNWIGKVPLKPGDAVTFRVWRDKRLTRLSNL